MNKIENVESAVKTLLSATFGTSIASIKTDTKVKLSAKNKHLDIRKLTSASVILFNHIKDYEIYYRAVMRSVRALNDNIDESFVFEKSEASFFHSDCFSIVINKKDLTKRYLYACYHKASSVYMLDNEVIEKNAVASYMTASEAKALLTDKSVVYSVKNAVYHNVICRTISLENIVEIKACKQSLTELLA